MWAQNPFRTRCAAIGPTRIFLGQTMNAKEEVIHPSGDRLPSHESSFHKEWSRKRRKVHTLNSEIRAESLEPSSLSACLIWPSMKS